MAALIASALPVNVEQRAELTKMAASTAYPHRIVVQATALLLAADGVANEQIARSCGVDSDTVRRWRVRFAQSGVDVVGVIAHGRGRRPSLSASTVARHAPVRDKGARRGQELHMDERWPNLPRRVRLVSRFDNALRDLWLLSPYARRRDRRALADMLRQRAESAPQNLSADIHVGARPLARGEE